ncbi:MAG TPA: BrnT family toxin [Gammaproteobacteria bacterium]|nr:BrnT family toxin [Gammaproteobacteria bacterium]
MTYFEWNENKRKHNLEKHGIDFMDAITIFDDPARIEFESNRRGEMRFQTIGMVHDVVLLLVYTLRGNKTRIISVRRASKNERKTYYEA